LASGERNRSGGAQGGDRTWAGSRQAEFDYVLIARRPALTSQFAALVSELTRAFAGCTGRLRGRGDPERG